MCDTTIEPATGSGSGSPSVSYVQEQAMGNFLPPSGQTEAQPDGSRGEPNSAPGEAMADLKIFWGPEICRLEYLVHLLDTGRIKDEHWRETA
jgi:hypothetical protein